MGDDEQPKDVKYVPADEARTDDLLSRFKLDGLGSIEMSKEEQMRLRAALQDATGLYFPGGFEYEEHNTPANHDPIQGTKTGIDGFPFLNQRCYHRPDQSDAPAYGTWEETIQREDPELMARIRAMLDANPDPELSDLLGREYVKPEPVCGAKTGIDNGIFMGPYGLVQEEDPELLRRLRGAVTLDDSIIRPVDISLADILAGHQPPVDLVQNPETGSYGMPKPADPEPDQP